MTKTISVIVPVYGELDEPSYLLALQKEVKNFQEEIELILVFDDTGTKKSQSNFKIISRLQQSNVEIYRSSFGSPGKARNYGLQKAKGEWLIFSDADDSPNIQEFLRMVSTGGKLNKDVCIGSYMSINLVNGKKNRFDTDPKNLRMSYKSIADSPGIWRFAFKRNTLGDITFPNLRMGEDQVFLIEYFSSSRSILFYQPTVYTYHTGINGQLTSDGLVRKKISNALKLSTFKYKRAVISDSNEMLIRMIINQALSTVKYGKTKDKIFGIRIIMKFKYILLSQFFRREGSKYEK